MSVMGSPWTVERRVTLALVFALFLQAAGGFVWIGATAERLDGLEAAAADRAPIVERMAWLEEQVAQVRLQLDRIERRLDVH